MPIVTLCLAWCDHGGQEEIADCIKPAYNISCTHLCENVFVNGYGYGNYGYGYGYGNEAQKKNKISLKNLNLKKKKKS